ncbi:pleckstrin homology domain-containing family G member 3 [Pseudophryne corroboree]|uniref:pleckstrin homology domain-containing family G member 3 n=1 Tax=Pseudophryne corroboree TaxID=495146 RepID=UPI003081D3DF
MEGECNLQEGGQVSQPGMSTTEDSTAFSPLKTGEEEEQGRNLEEPAHRGNEESPRLSAAPSSSNEKLSSSPSFCTECYDSDRPISVISSASSGSLREGRELYESTSSRPVGEEQSDNWSSGVDMELVSTAAGSLQATYRERQSGLKNTHTTNSSNGRSRLVSRSLSPFGTKVSAITHKLSYVERVVLELIETERMYVQNLRSIVEDYLGGIIDQPELPMKPEQVSALFGNIEDIYELNSELLQDLDSCSDDPVAVTSCFVEKSQYFDIYTQYCNNYPNSVATLTECMRNKVLAKFFREKQEMLNHSLPLGSYLLKPVQRILKYHLLLQEIAKHFDVDKEGYEVVEEAIETMTGVAWYINEMKRKHEHAVRQQEIQSLLLNWKGMDLTTYGELVLEGTFRVQRARSERTFFLFDKALLIAKKRGDHFVYKTHIPCSSLMLIESTRDSLCFTLTHYKNNKQQHNVQAKTVEEKRLWTHHIKKLILENHHAIIPQKAKEAILEMDAIYPGRYRYSPERVRKTMSVIDPTVTHRSGRRQSEPAKHILKQLGEKVGLKHAGSDGALLDFVDILQPSIGSLAPNCEHIQAEGDEEEPPSAEMSRGSGAELSASEEEDIQLGDDDQSRDSGQHDTSKGFKRQNSETSGNPEKRRSVEVTAYNQEVLVETKKNHSESEEVYVAELISTSEIVLESPVAPTDNQALEEESDTYSYSHDPLNNGVTENAEDLKTFSSEEDEEEATVDDSTSILPPSVLDQASVIAERFINNISRRSSLVLEDGKVIGYITPRLTSRSSSLLSLDCSDRIVYQNGSSEFQNTQKDVLSDGERVNTDLPLSKVNSAENVFEEKERATCKRRESILSYQDRQLLDKIKTYYDNAEHQDASFSIKRRESLTYIPTGLVRNSVFKINSLPRYDGNQGSLERQRMSSSSSNASIGNSRPVSWSDVLTSTKEGETEQSGRHTQHPVPAAESRIPDQQVTITDDEFKSPVEMIKVWEEMEKERGWKEKDHQEVSVGTKVTSTSYQDKILRSLQNEPHEPLIILEESDLSTITEESQAPTPESTSPHRLINPTNDLVFNDQDYKTPIKLHPTIMQLANCMEGDMSEKMKNKVYQLARQYSQRIKCNKPVPHRRLRDIEEDMRRSSLPSVQEEKVDEKCKLKPALSIPTYDHIVLQEHSPTTPTTSIYNDKSPKRLSFTSGDSPHSSSPVSFDCKSPLSPVNTEKFHWPDVRELRSRYTSTAKSGKSIPVNRSQSVPDRMMERNMDNPSHTQNKELCHSYSMNLKHSDSVNGIAEEEEEEEETYSGKTPNMNGGTEMLQNNKNAELTIADCYYISAEAPLDNNKKVIIMEKIPAASMYDLENDDTYVHIRSPTTREKISLKAVVERCKAYQESEEYRAREDLSKTDSSTDTVCKQSKPDPQLLTSGDAAHQNRVKNLRAKFQTMNSSSSKNSEVH